MAHDLNNLVTPIQTLLQLINEGISTEDVRDELLPVALRSVDTLREYVREALFFSQNSRPDFKLGRLDILLSEAADIIAPRCARKGLKVVVNAPQEVLVEMDKSLIKRMITNVLANAADASPEGAFINIDLTPPFQDRKGPRLAPGAGNRRGGGDQARGYEPDFCALLHHEKPGRPAARIRAGPLNLPKGGATPRRIVKGAEPAE